MCAPLPCLRPLADAEHCFPAEPHAPSAAAMASLTAFTPGLPLSYASGADDSGIAAADDSSHELPPAGAAARVLGMFAGVAPVVPQIHEARAPAAARGAHARAMRIARAARARLAPR